MITLFAIDNSLHRAQESAKAEQNEIGPIMEGLAGDNPHLASLIGTDFDVGMRPDVASCISDDIR